jgi:hypothetical protein
LRTLITVWFLLVLPACAQQAPEFRFLPKSTKIEDAKAKLEQKIVERRTFDPIHHRGDLAIVLSTLGVVIGGARLYVALRKHRRKKESLTPAIERGRNSPGATLP